VNQSIADFVNSSFTLKTTQMKNRLFPIALFIISFLSTSEIFAQKKSTITTTFWVAGVCGLCEEVIEKTMDTKGVVSADYNLDSNQLTVTYNSKKVSEERLHELLNDAGYDTEKKTCTAEQYSRVHSCCQYREQEKH